MRVDGRFEALERRFFKKSALIALGKMHLFVKQKGSRLCLITLRGAVAHVPVSFIEEERKKAKLSHGISLYAEQRWNDGGEKSFKRHCS